MARTRGLALLTEACPGTTSAVVGLVRAPNDGIPYLQWKDPDSCLWRDARSDLKQERRQENLLQALDLFLSALNAAERDTKVSVWEAAGVPDDMLARIKEAGDHPREWRYILGTGDGTR